MIGVIADDISGAAELGAIGLRYGSRAALVPAETALPAVDLVCVDTDSRAFGPEEAGRRAARVARALRQAGAEWIYKKVDSVLRGQVVAESDAISRELGARRILLAPANPGLGRIVRDGQYYFRGVPLAETDFALDPQYPRTSSRVQELLAPSTEGGDAFHRFPGLPSPPTKVGDAVECAPAFGAITLCRPGEALPAEGFAVAEVSNAEDLDYWAGQLDPSTLAAGAAEFFAAILKARGCRKSDGIALKEPIEGPELFVCGSVSESTRNFLRISRADGVPVLGLPQDLACADERPAGARDELVGRVLDHISRHRRTVLALELPPMERGLGPRMAARLAELAVAAIAGAPSVKVFAEGGATAAAVVRAAGWKRLDVAWEYAPGAVGTLSDGNKSTWFALKPGSYSWPAEVVERGRVQER